MQTNKKILDKEQKIAWEVLNRKIKKIFLNAMAARYKKKYREVTDFINKAQPVMIVGIKDEKGFCSMCPSSNKLIDPVIEKYINEPNSNINEILNTLDRS